ncbi:MAG TPA: hypothetical protein VIY48_15770 [Candidatus Paceibacterota bacterium]
MNNILAEVRLTYSGDAFGTVQDWRFSICQWLTDAGEYVPDFRGADELRDGYSYEYLVFDDEVGIPEACYALKILDRAREIMRVENLDY